MKLAMPPAVRGLPVLGSLLDYRRDHVKVFWQAYQQHGPIFSIRLGPQRAVVLIGPEHHRFFFTEVDRILSMQEMYKFVIPMFGEVLNAAETEVRKKQLAILQSAFQGKRMQRYIEIMVEETTDWLDSLGDEGSFELWTAFEGLGMRIAANALMGWELRQRIDEFVPLYRDLANGMEFVLPPNLPLPRFRRRDRARLKLTEMIQPMIAERQANPGKHNDFLQTLAEATYLDQSPMPSDAIVGLTLLTVFTGYISTAAQNCWTLIQLLQHQDYLAGVLEEQEAVLDRSTANLNTETLGRLERLDRALKETERMYPVMSHYARYNSQSYVLEGYHIPKGWLTMVCPTVAHRLPEVFSQPDTYDPERFSPERAEDRKHAYSLIGFGGGFYRCPGSRFGINEIKTMLSLLLQRYTLELVDPHPKPDYEIGMIRPKPPYLIRYRRRRSALVQGATLRPSYVSA
ncbi:MAG TPA: cytochrome P450 [Herpetosiphonaceae bacterium]